MPSFYTQENIGHAKYVVNFHDGIQTHKDGSPFFGIRIFKSKKAKDGFRNELRRKGYTETR